MSEVGLTESSHHPIRHRASTAHRRVGVEERAADVECRTAARGCVDCKKHLIGNMNAALEPFRARRAELLASPSDVVRDVLHAGDAGARAEAEKTMEAVRAAVRLAPEP